jgi:hypothetical protein
VPLALIGFSSGGPTYIDRAAVVRTGGRARARTPLVQDPAQRAGTPELWQARVVQLGDQLADLARAGVAPGGRAASLASLPPAGIVPLDSLTPLGTGALPSNQFFPAAFSVRAAPLPLEQLDAVLDRCSSLAPLDTGAAESVLLLVPVPQSVYEPRLLVIEQLDPIFDQTIATFVAERTDALGRRQYLRDRVVALVSAVSGPAAAPTYPAVDPAALEDEGTIVPVSTGEDTFGVVPDPAGGAQPQLVPQAFVDMRTALAPATTPFLPATEQTDLAAQGLDAYSTSLDHRIDQADDAVDYAFLRTHANIYRVRQVMLGTTVASRLAVSPALATIAQGDSAAAMRDQIDTFYQSIKNVGSAGPIGGVIVAPGAALAKTTPVLAATAAAAVPLQASLSLADVSFPVARNPNQVEEPAAVVAPMVFTPSGIQQSPAAGLAIAQQTETGFIGIQARVAIQDASPVVGAGGYDFRTSTIAKRLDDSPAREAHSFAVAARFEAVQSLLKLNDKTVTGDGRIALGLEDVLIQGVPVPGSFDSTTGLQVRQTMTLGAIAAGAQGVGVLLPDNGPQDGDESKFFLEAIRILEFDVGALRLVEARISAYRALLAQAQAALATVQAARDAAQARLQVIDGNVDESRHMVATARALRADEVLRLGAINDARATVLRQSVPFLAYVRPRTQEALVDAPSFPLDPGLLAPPVPACLAAHGAPPAELEGMIQLLRESPVSWFKHVPPVLDQLDRVELLQGTLIAGQLRAQTLVAQPPGTPGGLLTFVQRAPSTAIGQSLALVTAAQQAVVLRNRQTLAQLGAASFVGLGWRETRVQAVKVLSLGDLIEANHGKSAVSQAAASELQEIGEIAGCLHARVSDVDPAIRLVWVERLSQYQDQTVTLGSLSALPRWTDVPYADRHELQAFADWLYDRVDPSIAEALAWMHDLVRVCILLASDSPADEIIAGRVPAPTTAAPGGMVPVSIDPDRVTIGMRVMFFQGTDMVAHGVVDDLVGEQAHARVLETASGAAVSLATSTAARFQEAGGLFTPTFVRRAL